MGDGRSRRNASGYVARVGHPAEHFGELLQLPSHGRAVLSLLRTTLPGTLGRAVMKMRRAVMWFGADALPEAMAFQMAICRGLRAASFGTWSGVRSALSKAVIGRDEVSRVQFCLYRCLPAQIDT